jgi:hypothetical protein
VRIDNRKVWCIKNDEEITDDFKSRQKDYCKENFPDGCTSRCPFFVIDTEIGIRARKAIGEGRKQPTLFSLMSRL